MFSKVFVFVFCVLIIGIPGNSFATFNLNQSVVTCGDITFPDSSATRVLYAQVGSGNFQTFHADSDSVTTGYTPSGSLSFHVKCIKYTYCPSSPNIAIGYSTANVDNSAPEPTSPHYWGGYTVYTSASRVNANGVEELPVDFTIPNGQKPFMYAQTTCQAYLVGKEE